VSKPALGLAFLALGLAFVALGLGVSMAAVDAAAGENLPGFESEGWLTVCVWLCVTVCDCVW
jgi:hypothetical protein